MGNILSLDFFHVVKPLMPILPLLSMLSIYEKHERVVRKKKVSTLFCPRDDRENQQKSRNVGSKGGSFRIHHLPFITVGKTNKLFVRRHLVNMMQIVLR